MEDVEFLEKMDDPTNMNIVVSKLAYKIRERCCNAKHSKLRKGEDTEHDLLALLSSLTVQQK